MYTFWGYEVDTLPDLLTQEEFNAITGDAFADNESVPYALAAVSEAIRNYCGWHVSPNLTCTMKTTASGRFVYVPTLLLTDVETITDGDTELTDGDFEYSHLGIIRRCCFKQFNQGFDAIKVVFKSGIDDDANLKNICAQIVANAIAAPAGVAREQAGDVEIRYNQLDDGLSGGISLMPRDMMLLGHYKLSAVV